MAKAVQKITLSRSRDIPLDKLVLSQSNVRKIKADISIEELAEDIARRGLLQSLNVRPVLDPEGAETGMFDVPAGGRRFQALTLLVKQKRLAKNTPIPCILRAGGNDILPEDDSLAENTQRAALHPLDQFRAFQALREKGQTEEQIAAAFFVPASVVKQRLKLVTVVPELLDTYAADQMALEQLMAFTVSSDHERQIQVWNAVKDSWQREPHSIRRKLTETSVRCTDRRMRFVGIEAYEQAGGTRTRDLFEDDNGGWIDDVGLLDRLVGEKLKTEAEAIAAEGWKWVKADVGFEYGHTFSFRRAVATRAELTEEERATREALRGEFDDLEAEYADAGEYPDEVDARLGEIEALLDGYENRPETFEPADIRRAGVFISIANDGTLDIQRGYIRAEDEVPEAEEGAQGDAAEPTGDHPDYRDDLDYAGDRDDRVAGSVVTVGRGADEPEEDDGEVIKPLPDRLLSELTAYRTVALQDALARNPEVALTALLHKLTCDLFRTTPAKVIEASVRAVHPAAPDDLKSFPPALSITERHEAWQQDIPQEDDDVLWTWIAGLDTASRLALLAHCVSFGVNALHEKPNPYSGYGVSEHGLKQRMAEADRLSLATGLDMFEAGWEPTVDNYLSRVTKPRILEAVREAKGDGAAQMIDHLKKGDMATEAARLLQGTGWLPEIFRVESAEDAVDPVPDFEIVEAEDLPAFLADDAVGPQGSVEEIRTEDLVAAE
ncbi:ParB N-terminal domain-containing protein [Xinfangfangia sp. D13-10-4-6]|uniref:ParB/RepB/Spo0J family partition protein n=1 Tax=Pseudogemmobacter hezensis TaxID=2737662 RepID=UPI001557819E|nr:ParB/RepB/Spo0J family partition protein [Pseudogemmobacter hezensis]NPD15078.1 ParB N-terminal domain-containing protein [Pseudogemmobacter hezensis]